MSYDDSNNSDNKSRHRSYIINNIPYELQIPGYPIGSDITVINTSYIGRIKNEETGSFEQDYISILFRDNKTGAKMVHTIYEPYYTFYKINENKKRPPNHNLFFEDKKYLTPCTCKYANLTRALAEVTDRIEEYQENVRSGNRSENRKLHADPRILFSDMNIENYYRFLFSVSYTNKSNNFKINKGYMDIEVDIRYSNSEFPEPGEVPINAFAYCDEGHNMVYQFILNDPNNPLVEKYKQSFSKFPILDELKKFVISAVGGKKKAIEFGVTDLDYKLVFFDNELEMIKKMFDVVHKTNPDFIEFWNMAFDLNYIINRIGILGGDPIDIICDERVNQQFLRYYIDERNKNNYEERGDFVACSGYTVYIDQMIQFASRRKGRGRYQSFKLDAIGEVIANVKKLDYSFITNDIGELPYLDFQIFSFYNIMDVIVQKCIEKKTQDIEYVFTKCLNNNTNYAKAHRQSVYLANRFAKEFYNYGFIIGNNKNLWNEKPDTKFPGAMVGDPLHNSYNVMVKINGRPTLLSDNAVDFDYSSLYPSIILEHNIAPNCQIGRIIIQNSDNSKVVYSLEEHPDMFSSDDSTAKYSRGGEFLENLMSDNPIEFGRRWMGLGTVYDVLDDCREFFKFNGSIGRPIDTGFNDAIYFTKSNMIEAITFEDNYMGKNPIISCITLTPELIKFCNSKIKETAVL